MKKLTFKITKNLKNVVLAIALLGAPLLFANGKAVTKAAASNTSYAFVTVGLVAAMKKRNLDLDDDVEKVVKGIEDEVNEKLKELTEGLIEKDAFDAFFAEKKNDLLADLNAKNLKVGEGDNAKTVDEMFRDMGTTITTLKKSIDEGQPKIVSIKSLIEKGAKEVLGKDFDGDFKEALETIKERKTGFIQIRIKDAATMTIGGSTSSSPTSITNPYKPLIDTDSPVEIRQAREFVFDLVDLGSTDRPVLIWTEEIGGEGDIELVTEGNLKPLNDFDFQDYVSKYKKIAGYISLTDELMTDLPQLTSAIKRLFKKKVLRKYHDQVLADMIAVATTYVSTGLDDTITNPDRYAAIGAGTVQMNDSEAFPDTIVMNQVDIWAMRLQKDTTGQYVIPPMTTADGNTIAGYRVRVSSKITAGKFLLVESGLYEVDVYEDYTVRMGWINDDLIKNKFSMVGEMKFHSKIPNIDKVGIFYGDFATIQAALEDPTATEVSE